MTKRAKDESKLDFKSIESVIGDDIQSFITLAINYLPHGNCFNDDQWNVFSWVTRKGNSRKRSLDFSLIKEPSFKTVCKCFILDKRMRQKVGVSFCNSALMAFRELANVAGGKSILKLNNNDFLLVEKEILKKYKGSTPERFAGNLESIGKWLVIRFQLRISYKNSIYKYQSHGAHAHKDEGREGKLIHTSVISDLLSNAMQKGISRSDKFYLSLFVLLIPSGLRVGELTTLPVDCIIKDKDGMKILSYCEKSNRLVPKPIISGFESAVNDAYQYILSQTEGGRNAAASMRKKLDELLDWRVIFGEREVLRYFVKKFLHDWTSKEENRIFSDKGAWSQGRKEFIDVIKLKNELGSTSKVARHLKSSRSTVIHLLEVQELSLQKKLPSTTKSIGGERKYWHTDTRVASIWSFQQAIGKCLKHNKAEWIKDIFDEARDEYQLKGYVYPKPAHDDYFENLGKLKMNSVVSNSDGSSLLEPEDALLVVNQYQLCDRIQTNLDAYTLVDSKKFSRWLRGEKRARGTKSAADSVFSRLGIVDPSTNEIAKFTSHDVRHWLDTYLSEGGLEQEMIAAMFSRKTQYNATYDQTKASTRTENLRLAIQRGTAVGGIVDNYNSIAKYSKKDAEAFLLAGTLMVNLMPHGACTLNWGLEHCPNFNSCLNVNDGEDERGSICEHFVVDIGDSNQLREIEIVVIDADASLKVMPKKSPQYDHLSSVRKNAELIASKFEIESNA